MKYEEFKKGLDVINQFEKERDSFQDTISQFVDGNFICIFGSDLLSKYIDCFSKCINPKYHIEVLDWIQWHIWENDMGKCSLSAYDELNNEYIIKNSKTLYSFLKKLKYIT